MNIYRYKFSVRCPNDDKSIEYHLEVQTAAMVMAEEIVTACLFNGAGYHEVVADHLAATLPGRQTITATHSGVEVVTVRESNA